MTRSQEEYAKIGLNALLPGMRYMLEMMRREVDRLEVELNLPPSRRNALRDPNNRGGWSKLSPEERSAEMKRRLNRPYFPTKEERGKWAKEYWAKMTPEQRSAEMQRRRWKGQGVGAGRPRVTPRNPKGEK